MTNYRSKYYLFSILFLLLSFPKQANAQFDAGSSINELKQKEKEDIYLPQPSSLRILFASGLVHSTERDRIYDRITNLDSIPEQIDVDRLEITGNTILDDEPIESFISSMADNNELDRFALKQLIDKINRTYSELGYVTSGVWNEPEVKANGAVVVRITEGKVKEIELTGLGRLNANYVRQRLNVNDGRVLNLNDLTQALQLLKTDGSIADLSATVFPTKNLEHHRLKVEVKEADPFYLELSLDNLGFPSSGSFRRQLKINHDNLLGFSDRLYAAYTNTDGRNSLDVLNYSLPINSHDGRLDFSYAVGKSEIIEEPLSSLDIDLKSSAFQFGFHQPIYQTPKDEIALGLAVTRIATETTLFDSPFPLARGSDDGELNISTISFYQDYTKRGLKDRFDLRSEISLGVDLFDATNNNESPDTNFFVWRGQGSYRRKLNKALTLSFTSLFQLSDRELVYFQQTPYKLFTVGKEEEAFILRGYRRGSLEADNGVFASGELQADVATIKKLNSTLQVIPFIDFGTAWNNDDVELDESTLISAGMGLRLLVNDNFRARVDWGIPLIDSDFDRGSLQEDGVTFNIEYRPL